MTINKIVALLITCNLVSGGLQAFAPNNFFVPYDVNIKLPGWEDPEFWEKTPFRFGLNVELGSTDDGRDIHGHKSNILNIYNASEAVIPMLMSSTNPAATTLLQSLIAAYPGQALDDGTRGHVKFHGDFDQADVTLHGRYLLPLSFAPGKFTLSMALPIRHASVDGIQVDDQTKDILPVDLDIKAQLTGENVFQSSIKSLGGPDLGSWSKTGVGDFVAMLEWQDSYQQEKENLKTVTLFARLGVSIPTAVKHDEDKAFSLPLGSDGAWGMPLGAGMWLDFVNNIRFGLDVDFFVLFDESRVRRLKTEEHQTEFLLLNKGDATKDHGLTWKFNLFLQAYHFYRTFSAKFAYQYLKHDDDRLIPRHNDFDYSVVNTDLTLSEWNMHNFIFSMNYDFFDEAESWWVKPQASLFVKIPVAGKGIINPFTFGGQLAINF